MAHVREHLEPRRREDSAHESVMHRSKEAPFLFSSAHSRVAKPAAFRGVGQAAHGRPSDHGRHCGDRSSNVLDRDVRSFRLSLKRDLKSLEHTASAVVRLSLKRYNVGSVGPGIRSTRRKHVRQLVCAGDEAKSCELLLRWQLMSPGKS